MNLKQMLKGATILLTGGTGSWSHELVAQLLEDFDPKEIRIYSRGEMRQYDMKLLFKCPKLTFIIGDVRDKERLRFASKGVDYIIHLAALKHVPVCEENPYESVMTNIIGTRNLTEVAIENKVKKVIDVSTDKAVDPLNIYGVTKSCGEKLVVAANTETKITKFACVRAGNVLGTNGSIIPLFKKQILAGEPLTITDERMTRFFMSVSDAIQLILYALENSIGGEIYVSKIPSCKIFDLAQVMQNTLSVKNKSIKQIGMRPGEKLSEVLVSKYEAFRTFDQDSHFIIMPYIDIPETKKYYSKVKLGKGLDGEFNSENTRVLTQKELAGVLKTDGWI